jgi:hypothetical protein
MLLTAQLDTTRTGRQQIRKIVRMLEHYMWLFFGMKISSVVLFCYIIFRAPLDLRLRISRQVSVAKGLGKVALVTRQT